MRIGRWKTGRCTKCGMWAMTKPKEDSTCKRCGNVFRPKHITVIRALKRFGDA